MKTIRELINLIETAQNPVDRTVRVLPDVGEIGIDSDASPGNGSWYVKLYDGSYDVVGFNSEAEAWRELSSLQDLDTGNNDEQGVAEGKNNIDDKIIHLMTNGIPADEIARKLDIPVEWVHEVAKYNMPDSAIDYNDPRNSTQGRERFGEQGVAEGQATRTCPQCDGSGEDTLDPTKSCRRCGGKGHIPMSPREQGVAEALSKTDLLKQVSAKLNDPEFRKQPADPTKSFTRGDHWQGAKPGDYGYTGYQGHGMPTDRAERARIRADKKKGLPEDEATAQKYAVRMNAQQLGSTNRTKYTWTGTASSDDQAREMAIAYADRHGFKNIVVKEISKKEQAVDEQATPEAVAKINSLFSR